MWLLSAVMLVNRAGAMVLPFIALYLTQERGMAVTAAGRVLSVYGLGSVAGSWLGGWVSDRVGPDRALLASLAGSGVAFLCVGGLSDFWPITIGVFFLSVISEAFRPACMSAMAHRAPAELRVRSFALLRLAANLGVGIGPAAGGVLALHDYRMLFVVDALTCWLAAWLLIRFPATRTTVEHAPVDGQAPARSPFADGPFLLLLALVTVLAIAFFQVFSTLPLYLRESYGLREDAIGLLLAANAAIIVLFEMVLIHRAERYDRMSVVAVGAALVCLGFGLMPFGQSMAWAAFTVVIWTIGEMLALPMLNVVAAERAGPLRHGRYLGLYTMAYSVAFAIAPASGAWVYATVGTDSLWYAVGLLAVPLSAAFWLLRPVFRGPGRAAR
ncbi:MAG TPA: MFS transporter [Candidatus Polarisedimenticolaceae bacterium]|nr:MFS transporter [Candidatus Polarisedimenticolaceae bacterium]